MIKVPAGVTQMIGGLISIVIGYNAALFAGSIVENVTQNPDFYQLGFWPVFVFVALLSFFGGLQGKMPAGWNGVPTLIGARIEGVALGEGFVWVLPFIMGNIPVDCRIRIREQLLKDGDEKDLPMSEDGLAMWTKFLLIFQVVDPYKWLSVDDPMHGLYDIAEKILRDAIATKDADKLRTASEKSHIGETITRALLDAADDYGIHVFEAAVPVMRPPADYEKALARIPIEKAERKAEEVQNEAVISYLKRLQDEGNLGPREAMASIQIERDKVKAERHIYSVEGSEEIAQAVARAFESIFARRQA